jgi:DNA-binding XRE family transcriptional regulator
MKKHVTAPAQEEKHLTRRQLAERHNVSQETVKRREKDCLKAIKVGRLVRYRLSDILLLKRLGKQTEMQVEKALQKLSVNER